MQSTQTILQNIGLAAQHTEARSSLYPAQDTGRSSLFSS